MKQTIQIYTINLEGKDNTSFEAEISKQDRLNDSFYKIMKNGKVEGVTELVIDELVIKPLNAATIILFDRDGQLCINSFKCVIKGIQYNYNNVNNADVVAFSSSINNRVSIGSYSNKTFNSLDKSWTIKMCKMIIPYNTYVHTDYIED